LTLFPSLSVPLVPCLLVPRLYLEPDGRALEPKGRPDLVLEEALEGEVQLHVAIGEQHKSRWGHRRLCHVKDANALRHRDRRPLEIDLIEEAVHLSGGHALATFRCDSLDLAQYAAHSFSIRAGHLFCRKKDDRR